MNELTLSAWVNMNAQPFGPILSKGALTPPGMYAFGINSNGRVYVHLNSVANAAEAPFTFCPNQWYQITVVLEPTAAFFYVDGTLIGSQAFTTNIVFDSQDLEIGKSGSEYFNGQLDEVRLYNRALSACEVAAIFSPADDPIITAFAPNTGQVGTSVTLTGFDPLPGNNVVRFNGTTASVLAATTTSLEVAVPAGATSGFIQVQVGCNSSITSTPFSVIPFSPTGEVVQVNGTTDRIEVQDDAALHLTSLTLETWINFESVNLSHTFIAKTVNQPSAENSFLLGLNNGFLVGQVNHSPISHAWTPATNQWYHLAYTFDETSLAQVLYINGVSVAVGTAAGGVVYDTGRLVLAADVDFGAITSFFHGRMEEVRIWNRARTQAEIQSDLYNPLSGTESGLIAYYNMDETGRGQNITVNNNAITGSVLNGITRGTRCTPIFTSPPAPTLSAFTPNSGEIGTTITIQGAGFSTVARENEVLFGGKLAQIISFTATQLVARVPAGAVSAPIEVRVNCASSFFVNQFSITPFACPPTLRTGGERDISFDARVEDERTFRAIEIQSTGKSVVSIGAAVPMNGVTYEGLVRFNTDGSIDNTFASSVNYFPNQQQLWVLPDDKILVVDVGTQSYVRRLNADGTLDNSFNAPGYYGSTIYAVAAQADGKVLVSVLDGSFVPSRQFIYRLDPDGSTDASFTPLPDFDARVIQPLSSGKILLAGVNGLMQLDATGVPDPTFSATVTGTINDLVVQSDGKIIVIGRINQVNAVSVAGIARLNPNGTLDATFASGNGIPPTPGNEAYTIEPLPAGGWVLAGRFNTYNDVARNRVIVINDDGSLRCSFDPLAGPDAAVRDVAVQSDGKILAAGAFVDYNGEPAVALVRINTSSPIPPAITGFVPGSGPIGTSVTLSGLNFDPVAANNTVFFGATRGQVTAASATQLVVTVPPGATDHPITVTVAGLTAHAAAPFRVTFCSVPGITTGSFPNPTSLATATGAGPVSTAVGDVDGDGKADLIVANRFANTVSVFRNTSTAVGNLSYAPRVDLIVGSEPVSVSFGDLDGDGKGDLAVAVFGSSQISIFRNTSTAPGSISFSARFDLAAGTAGVGPFSVALGDFDNNGKTDVAAVNLLNHRMIVLPNASEIGILNFANRIEFPMGAGVGPYALAVADIDGDGRQDVITANVSNNSISVFPNTSTGRGNFAFGSRINFSTGTLPRSVTITDLDNDGKPDIAATAQTPSIVSVFRNISTAGSPSLAARQDFAVGSTPWIVAAADFDGDGKPDLATANEGGANVSILRNTTTTSGTITLASVVNLSPVGGLVALSAGDFDNDGKQDIAAAEFNGDFIRVFRNAIPTAVPTITSFTPTFGSVGTTVTITGSNFNTPAPTSVTFNGVATTPASFTATTITVLVPSGATTGPIQVIGCATATSGSNFTIGAPATITISPQPTDVTTCSGNSATFSLSASGTTNITYQWQYSPTNIPFAFTNITDGANYSGTTTATLSVQTSGGIGAGWYRCIVNGDFAPTTASATANLTLNAIPAAPGASAVSICSGSSATITATGGSPGQYRWYTVATGGTPLAGETNGTFTTPALTTNTDYFVAINNGSCESTRTLAAVTVNIIPLTPTASSVAICSGSTATITATGGSPGQYRWYTAATGGTPLAGETNGTFTTPVLSTTTNYFVAINTGTCESARTPVTVTVHALPAKPVITASGPLAICSNQSVTLTATGGATYLWSNAATTAAITVATAGSYTVIIRDGNGCSSVPSDPAVVTIISCATNQPPVIAATTVTAVINGLATLRLTDIISDPDNNLNLASLRVVTPPLSGASATIDQSGNLTVNYQNVAFAGRDELLIEACDQAGLCVQQRIFIDVDGDIIVYNAFSPNGDAFNNAWIIQNIETLADTRANKVAIFNRWGDTIWEGENYDNRNVVFVGLNKNGNEVASGTYFYKIEFPGGRATRTGYLTLRR